MSTPFQNRLVGTVIVAAAIIIFLPDILDGEKKSYQADFEAIPQAPKFSSADDIKTFPQDKLTVLVGNGEGSDEGNEQTLDDVDTTAELASDTVNDGIKVKVLTKEKTPKPTKATKATKVTKAKDAKTQQKQKNLPEKAVVERAWVIHLGSFKHQQNVKELLAKLKKNGYVAFTKPIKTKNGTLTKVFVGPELIKSSLDKKLPKLKALTNVQGKVARYYANK